MNAADSTKEVRRTYLQNVGGWRHDIVVVLDASGRLLENVKYLSYGTPFACPAGDTELKGSWQSSDSTRISSYAGSYDIRFDPTHNGVIDAADITYANSIKSGYQTLGLGVLSSTAVANRKGYAGYEHAPELAGTKWHVRNRVLDSELGRWTRRDPLGYIGSLNLYVYVDLMPLLFTDLTGLAHQATSPRVTININPSNPPPVPNTCFYPSTGHPAPIGATIEGIEASFEVCRGCKTQSANTASQWCWLTVWICEKKCKMCTGKASYRCTKAKKPGQPPFWEPSRFKTDCEPPPCHECCDPAGDKKFQDPPPSE